MPGTGQPGVTPRAAHQRAPAPRPAAGPTRSKFKVTVGPNGVPLRPELLPALHQPPPSSQPVPTPWNVRSPAAPPCSRAARGATYSNPEPARTPRPSHLELSSNTRAKLRVISGAGWTGRLPFTARPPLLPPAAGLVKKRSPRKRPTRRAGAGLLSSEV